MLRRSEKALVGKVGKRVADLRKAKGYSQVRLAAATGLSAGHIGQIEQGRRHPTLVTIYRLCSGLEIEVSELFREL